MVTHSSRLHCHLAVISRDFRNISKYRAHPMWNLCSLNIKQKLLSIILSELNLLDEKAKKVRLAELEAEKVELEAENADIKAENIKLMDENVKLLKRIIEEYTKN